MKISHSGKKTPLFTGNGKGLFSGVKKRLSGQRKFGNQWVSKERKQLAKKVMKHDGDFLRQNTYAKDVGPFQITKKVGTRKERQRNASNMVSSAFKGVRGTKSTKKNTLPMEQYLTYGMSKKKKSAMDNATASLGGKQLEQSLMNRYYGKNDKHTKNAIEQNNLNSSYANLDAKTTPAATTSTTTSSVTPTQTTETTKSRKNKNTTSSRSSSKGGGGATVSLGALGTSLTYYKRGGKMKKGGGFSQHD